MGASLSPWRCWVTCKAGVYIESMPMPQQNYQHRPCCHESTRNTCIILLLLKSLVSLWSSIHCVVPSYVCMICGWFNLVCIAQATCSSFKQHLQCIKQNLKTLPTCTTTPHSSRTWLDGNTQAMNYRKHVNPLLLTHLTLHRLRNAYLLQNPNPW